MSRGRQVRKGGSSRKPGRIGSLRVPAFVVLPLCLAVGWFVAEWAGAVFGGIVGVLLWRSRV